MSWRLILAAAILGLLATTYSSRVAHAGEAAGLHGRVYDLSTGKAFPGAVVHIVGQAGYNAEVKADSAGFFTMLDLPPGHYGVSTIVPGAGCEIYFGYIDPGEVRTVNFAMWPAKGLLHCLAERLPTVDLQQTVDVYDIH